MTTTFVAAMRRPGGRDLGPPNIDRCHDAEPASQVHVTS